MKGFTTVICCFIFMLTGAFLAFHDGATIFPGHRAAMASPTSVPPIVYNTPKMPLGLQLHEAPGTKDSVVYITKHDTIERVKTVIKPKYVRVSKPESTTAAVDTMYMPVHMDPLTVSNKISMGSEEQPKVIENTQSPKQSEITLTVDGNVVYSTENLNHSGVEGQ